MNAIQLILLALIFLLVFGAAIGVARLFLPNAVQERLDAVAEGETGPRRLGPAPWIRHVMNFSQPLVKLSIPAEGWETSPMRLRFIHAGLRTPSAPQLFFAAKTGLTVFLPLAAFLASTQLDPDSTTATLALWMMAAALLGNYGPDLWLRRRVRRRQREVFESFPDALDLLTVCVEAGMAMDAGLSRVASEIGLKSSVLAEELQMVTLELRAGSGKDKALRNLALRTGVEDVDALVSMLIQAERFGTSIGDSLRVQSDTLRTKRRQRAEEQAAKIGTKLLLPLIFLIFPALLVVLMGPAALQISRTLGTVTGTP